MPALGVRCPQILRGEVGRSVPRRRERAKRVRRDPMEAVGCWNLDASLGQLTAKA